MRLACLTSLVALACLASGGCSHPAPAAAPRSDGAKLLASCDRQSLPPDVTSWNCGNLTAVETVVLNADDRDVKMAFEGFAASFGGDGVRRLDSVYQKGDTRHTAMRIEGKATSGEPVEAQMVAVMSAGGVRLITCSSRAASACGPVIEHLVGDVPGFKKTIAQKPAGQDPGEFKGSTGPGARDVTTVTRFRDHERHRARRKVVLASRR